MNYLRHIRRVTAAFLTLSLIVLAGCTDRMLVEPPEETTPAVHSTTPSNLGIFDTRSDTTDTILEPQRIIERY